MRRATEVLRRLVAYGLYVVSILLMSLAHFFFLVPMAGAYWVTRLADWLDGRDAVIQEPFAVWLGDERYR